MTDRAKSEERAARLAEQLRANLRRRKAQPQAAADRASDQPDLSKKDGER